MAGSKLLHLCGVCAYKANTFSTADVTNSFLRKSFQLLWVLLGWPVLQIFSHTQLQNPLLFTCIIGAHRGINRDCDPIFLGNIQTCCGREFLSGSIYKLNRQHRHMGGKEIQKHREVSWLGKAMEHVRGRDEHGTLISWGLKTFLSSTKWVLGDRGFFFLRASQNASTGSVVHRGSRFREQNNGRDATCSVLFFLTSWGMATA